MKRFFIFLVAFSGLMVTTMPLHAKVTQCSSVAEINNAILHATSIYAPDTILLTQDINGAAAIMANGNYNFVLDLGGHTIVGSTSLIGDASSYSLFCIANGAKATIINGSLRGTRNGMLAVKALIYAASTAEVLVQNVSMYEKIGACIYSVGAVRK